LKARKFLSGEAGKKKPVENSLVNVDHEKERTCAVPVRRKSTKRMTRRESSE